MRGMEDYYQGIMLRKLHQLLAPGMATRASASASDNVANANVIPTHSSANESSHVNVNVNDSATLKKLSHMCPYAADCTHMELSDVLSKVDQKDDLRNTVKQHRAQMVLAMGTSAERWKDHIEKIEFVGKVVNAIQKTNENNRQNISLLIGEIQTRDKASGEVIDVEREERVDVFLYPHMVRFEAVNIQQIVAIVRRYIMNMGKETDEPDIQGEKLTDSVHVLVCCHKMRDKRCGKIGTALVKQLRNDAVAIAPDVKQRLVVIPTSHVGGHKFAGNAIVHPPGQWFGRITPCQSSDIIRAYLLNDESARDSLEHHKRGELSLLSW